MKYMNWKIAGILLGLLSVAAVALVKPIGVSTQYVVADGMILSQILPDFVAENAYMQKYAKHFGGVGYGFIFVIGMILGGFLSRLTGGPKVSTEEAKVPAVWKEKFGDSVSKRFFWAAVGGFLIVFGARMAGGCTSGHILSGVAQMSVSGLIFAAAVFLAAIPTAIILYKKGQ